MKSKLLIAAIACLGLAACQQQEEAKKEESKPAAAEQSNEGGAAPAAPATPASPTSYFDANENQNLAEQAPAIDAQQETANTAAAEQAQHVHQAEAEQAQ